MWKVSANTFSRPPLEHTENPILESEEKNDMRGIAECSGNMQELPELDHKLEIKNMSPSNQLGFGWIDSYEAMFRDRIRIYA